MKKAMLSQPINGKTSKEIQETRERAIAVLKGLGYEVLNTPIVNQENNPETFAKLGVVNPRIYYLTASLLNMQCCHLAYFCKGWEEARGCKIEHEIAKAYGVQIMYEE